MAHSTEQLPSAAHLPPQLANALGDAASNVAELCFMAPGIPWSAQMLDDMLADFHRGGEMTTGCISGDFCIRAAIILKTTRKRPCGESLVAYIQAKRSSDPQPIVHAKVYDAAGQPFDRAGLRKQIEWCQQTANDILRRGYCGRCYHGEPPAKRLRVSGTQACGRCLFARCLQPSDSGRPSAASGE